MQICRTRFNKEIVTEFVPSSYRKSRKVMIFCSGIPSAPSKDETLMFWAKKGFWTFFPRYRGTWESDGVFLEKSLERDVIDVIDGLPKGFEDYWGGESYQLEPKSITVIGSSFGGPAAMLATKDPRVDKAICLSPVVDWVEEDKSDPLDVLYHFLREAYGNAYRMDKRYWSQLKLGKYYNPVNHIDDLDARKILIFHAKDDQVVQYKPVSKFCTRLGCQLVTLTQGGHLSSSLLMQKRYYHKVKQFIQS